MRATCRLAYSLCLVSLLGAAGCRVHEVNEVGVLDYDATQRGAFVSVVPLPDGGERRQILAEPSPDVVLATTYELLAKLDYKEVSGELSVRVAEAVSQLGKRTQMIMFLRESLYRLAEMSHNSTLTTEQQTSLFKEVLGAALSLVEIERIQAGNAAKAAASSPAQTGRPQLQPAGVSQVSAVVTASWTSSGDTPIPDRTTRTVLVSRFPAGSKVRLRLEGMCDMGWPRPNEDINRVGSHSVQLVVNDVEQAKLDDQLYIKNPAAFPLDYETVLDAPPDGWVEVGLRVTGVWSAGWTADQSQINYVGLRLVNGFKVTLALAE